MTYSYYPGCTLKTKAKELDRYARLCMSALGAELRELDNWQCCGGVYTSSSDEIATKLSSVRALLEAEQRGEDLITLCSACHNVIKRVRYELINDKDFAFKVNNYIKPEEPFSGKTRVIHFLEFLRDVVGFDNLKAKVVKPFAGKRIAAYYGCLLLRPGKVLGFDDPENPTIIEDFIRAIGAEPVVYPYRNECCGGYISLSEKDKAKMMCDRIKESAAGFGAEMLITACPLCMYNLNKGQTELPVYYFTELLAEALGLKEEGAEI